MFPLVVRELFQPLPRKRCLAGTLQVRSIKSALCFMIVFKLRIITGFSLLSTPWAGLKDDISGSGSSPVFQLTGRSIESFPFWSRWSRLITSVGGCRLSADVPVSNCNQIVYFMVRKQILTPPQTCPSSLSISKKNVYVIFSLHLIFFKSCTNGNWKTLAREPLAS